MYVPFPCVCTTPSSSWAGMFLLSFPTFFAVVYSLDLLIPILVTFDFWAVALIGPFFVAAVDGPLCMLYIDTNIGSPACENSSSNIWHM
jgi:hypothetical protein